MDSCGICLKPAEQLFETGKEGVYACFKCQPLVPEVTIGDSDQSQPQSSSEQKQSQLQSHLRNHRAERRFVCTYCNKAFSQSNNLRAHLRIHTNERPFKCNECGKAFTQVTNLNNHVRLHTGERPFVCDAPGCGKAYAQVTNLNQHRKRHLAEDARAAPHCCARCGDVFTQRSHLYNHKRDVHGEKPARVSSRRSTDADRLQPEQANDDNGSFPCVFSSCGRVLRSPAAHTEHLLREHQLRVLAQHSPASRRGRPPKVSKDPLELTESDYSEVKILKQPQYLPKLKVQSLFQ